MKSYNLSLGLLIVAMTFSCKNSSTSNTQSSTTQDTLKRHAGSKNDSASGTNKIVYDDRRENLKLTVTDTITRSANYLFSNARTEDRFVLRIAPGMVKNSKAELQIIAAAGNVIYSQKFDAFYFVRDIFEPDTVPTTGGQEAYDAYMEHYWKSITEQQYEAYFKKSVDSFFNNIYPIERISQVQLDAWKDDITDKDFRNEAFADSTVKLLDITCFDCDEGGAVIGYSRKRGKVVTLLEHD